MTSTTERPGAVQYRPLTRIVISILIAAIVATGVNALIAWIAQAVGVGSGRPGFTVGQFGTLTLFGVTAAAIGWHLVNRYSRSPRAVFRWLVPTLIVISFLPDLSVGLSSGTSDGWAYAATLMVMHVATALICVATFWRTMPVRRSENSSAATSTVG